MKKLIHKHSFGHTLEPAKVELPSSAKFNHIAIQHNHICVWYELDEQDNETKEVEFIFVGTGYVFELSDKLLIGSITEYMGALVIHAYCSPNFIR